MRQLYGPAIGGMLVLGMMAAGGAASAQEPTGADERVIEVLGVGEVRVVPDEAQISFAVETFAETAQAAGAENARIMERVIAALVAAGVPRDDLETQNYSLHPEYIHEERAAEPRIRGYRASNQMVLTTRELDRIGALIDVALAAGANRMNGVGFSVSDVDAATAAALTQAVARARESARTIANALGVELGQVVRASTSTAPPPPAVRMERMDVAMAAAAPVTPISPGEQTVRATVSLTFAID
jgi:uncharacterized protein YggE